MTRDEMQTKACERLSAIIDGITWAIEQIKITGPGNDRVSDMLQAIQTEASRAFAINNRICADDLDECLANGQKSRIAMTRPISAIAAEIKQLWPKPYFGAVPYLFAMHRITSVTDMYGADSAKSIVLYFLANAQTWRGPDARRIKAELKEVLSS